MKSIKYILLLIIGTISTNGHCQKDLSSYKNIDGILVTSNWGDITISGTNSETSSAFVLEAVSTDESKKPKIIKQYEEYVTFKIKKKKLLITVREPKGFVSVDLSLKVPEHLLIEVVLTKGGNILVENFKNGVEINSYNGSVKIDGIHKYALVNAANGEIYAGFKKIDKNSPISLVTMNGGITAVLPENTKRDVRLISRKNGHIASDFNLTSDKGIANLPNKGYSKSPIEATSKINGGGALLFLSTENGPIAIKKGK